MSVAGKITVDLETRTQGWTAGLDKAGKEVSGWVKDVGGKFSALTFGKGANFNGAGVTAFAGALKDATKQAVELAAELRTGGSVAGTFGKLVDSIPIVGTFKQAGDAIRELVTGEQALQVEMGKVIEHNGKLADSFREATAARSLRGKYGDERAHLEIETGQQAAVTALHRERGKIAAEIAVLDAQQEKADNVRKGPLGDGVVASMYDLTEAQKSQRARLVSDMEANKNKTVELGPAAMQKDLDLTKEENLREYELHKANEDKIEDLAAESEAKALKAQGKALEARLVMNRRAQDRLKDDMDDEIRPEKLELLGLSGKNREARIDDNRANLASGMKDLGDTEAELLKAIHRKAQEEELGNAERLREIQATAGLERLKLQDEQANAFAERRGEMGRSHLAEAAEIEEAYTRLAGEIGKKNREQYGLDEVTYDPNTIAQYQAAKAERDSKMDVLGEKSRNEAVKNQEASLKEQRKLWEDVGTPLEKYAAHLADINEQFEKFHDVRLRDAQIKDIDGKALADLEKLYPDRSTKFDLYGRTQSYVGATVNDPQSVAKQQLEVLKRQAAKTDQIEQHLHRLAQDAGGVDVSTTNLVEIYGG